MTKKQELDRWLVGHQHLAVAAIGFLIGTSGEEAIQRTLLFCQELERIQMDVEFRVEPNLPE